MFVRQALLTPVFALRVYRWQYIKSNDLKKDSKVQCDELLAAVYARTMDADNTLKFTQIIGFGGKEGKHLTPPPA